jgi:hypothetical protein
LSLSPSWAIKVPGYDSKLPTKKVAFPNRKAIFFQDL